MANSAKKIPLAIEGVPVGDSHRQSSAWSPLRISLSRAVKSAVTLYPAIEHSPGDQWEVLNGCRERSQVDQRFVDRHRQDSLSRSLLHILVNNPAEPLKRTADKRL